MQYPSPGQLVLDRYTLPRFDVPNDLAQAKGMKNGALANLPAPRGGILRYSSALLAGRTVYQDDFSTFDGWVLDETTGTWARDASLPGLPLSGEMAPASHIYGAPTGWYGPLATKDLGQDAANGAFAVDIDWLNNSVGATARCGFGLFDSSMNAIGAVELTDTQQATATSALRWYGSGFVIGTAIGSIGTSTISAVNPNSGTAWFGLRKSGTTLTAFGPTGEQASYVVGGAGAVRYVVLYAQAYRISPTNYPYLARGAIKDFRALLSPANTATAALAIGLGAGGYAATIPNAFDGLAGSYFISFLNDVANYGGAAYLGQQRAEAARYPALEYLRIKNSNSGTSFSPTDVRVRTADTPAGPWTTVATFSGLSQANAGFNVLQMPVGLAWPRCWVLEPTAGIGVGSNWRVDELEAYYSPTPPNPSSQVPSYFADGAWNMDTPAQGFNPLPSFLGW